MTKLKVYGTEQSDDVPTDTPLPWVIRGSIVSTGTKLGGWAVECGACTVHLDGEQLRMPDRRE